MRYVQRVCGSLVFALVTVSCSDSPSAPSPTAGGLTLSPSDSVLMMPGSQTVTATATYSEGTSKTVTPVWTIDDTRVATVDGGGRVTAVGAGAATVIAAF